MTLSFGELMAEPAGSLVFLTSDGSITFDQNLADKCEKSIYCYDSALDQMLRRQERSEYTKYHRHWQCTGIAAPHDQLYSRDVHMTAYPPTMPFGLLLNDVFVHHDSVRYGYAAVAYVEILVEKTPVFMRLNVFDFFNGIAANDEDRFELLQSGRVVLH
jgi:hypothetical protein